VREDDLAYRVTDLARALREAGAETSLQQTVSALRALRLIDLKRRGDLRWALAAALVSRPEELPAFNYYFELYFTPGLDKTPPAGGQEPPAPVSPSGRLEGEPDGEAPSVPPREMAAAAGRSDLALRRDFARLDPDEADEALRLTRLMSRRLAKRLHRRLRASARDRRPDFRRTFRASLQQGGELIDIKHRARRTRPARVVVLGDVSGSMQLYTRFFFVFMHGLTRVLPRSEAFVFSTRVERVTPVFRRAAARNLLEHLGKSGLPLGGGTYIGRSVRSLLRDYSSALTGARTTVFIISDGWDRGEPDELKQAAADLARRCRLLVWLNPLAADPDYEPLARGMAAALPYLDALLPFSRLSDITRLEKRLLRM
jgi:uncharacterized protein with von Willebrand factor type A (vWA) domain